VKSPTATGVRGKLTRPCRFPVHVRDVGMSFATATTWCFNFILSFTWPHLLTAFKPQGAFAWYGAWCLILWCLILLFVPETKVRPSLTLMSGVRCQRTL
jgi:hypothetical protein